MTLTFVENRHPYKLLHYLTDVRKYKVDESVPGIYTITGDVLPVQIIESKKLSESENLWIKSLTTALRVQVMDDILESVYKRGLKPHLGDYLDVLIRANNTAFEEALKMGKTYPTMEEIFIRTGFAERFEKQIEERAREQEKEQIAFNLLKEGLPIDTIARAAELPVERVRTLAAEVPPMAP
jgi:hypothetical protein